MSTYVIILEVVLLVITSAICSGLNIAVMSLDIGDLRRKAKLGNRQARRVLPLRQRTHLTLASILLTNVAAQSATRRLGSWSPINAANCYLWRGYASSAVRQKSSRLVKPLCAITQVDDRCYLRH